jgi:hypothetical protein
MTAVFAEWRNKGSRDPFHSRNLGRSACFGRRLNPTERRMQMKTRNKVKAGALPRNHNESQVRDAAPGLKVKTIIKAGSIIWPRT